MTGSEICACILCLCRLLDKSLQAAGFGVGVDIPRNMWSKLAGANALDDSCSDLLASLDAAASTRLHILLVADDQILPESSLKKLSLASALADDWAKATAQEYHVGKPDKTAVLLLGQAARTSDYKEAPISLGGQPVPCATIRTWCGITWDSWLSFIPFLEARVAAAHAAFTPLCALARERSAPLEEIRSVMRSTVERTLFFGGMFLGLAQDAFTTLDKLQLHFERSLLGAPPWLPSSQVRAVASWSWLWSDRLLFEVLAFRAELWCSSPDMLVHEVWLKVQSLPGNTFANASWRYLAQANIPEVYDVMAWQKGWVNI